MLKHNYEKLFTERSSQNSTIHNGNASNRKFSRLSIISKLVRHRRRIFLLVILLFVIFSFFSTSGLLCTYSFCTTNSQTFNTIPDRIPSLIKSQTEIDYLTSTKLAIDTILLSKFGHSYDSFEFHKNILHTFISFDQIHDQVNRIPPFNLEGNDVLVFLHMQKTGGSSFDRHLTRDLILKYACKCETKKKKKCGCLRPNTNNQYWLFSRYSLGWKCGLHADYTELVNCVDRVLDHIEKNSTLSSSGSHNLKETEVIESSNYLEETKNRSKSHRYFYLTLLRDPVSRFISEFKHVQRGATWKTSRHWCGGRLPTIKELPPCFTGPNWKGVQIEDFLNCKHNLAFNRQTRMLADLNLVNCYNHSFLTQTERDQIMLHSARRNLEKMSFFGLCEEQIASQYQFEKTFNLKFKKSFIQFNLTRSLAEQKLLSAEVISKIRQLNHLDMELYSFAKKLFRKRFNYLRNNDENFDKVYFEMIKNSKNQTQKAQIKVRTTDEMLESDNNHSNNEDDKDIPDESAGAYDEKTLNSLEDYYSV